MIVAIDYDGTFTEDPAFFREFISLLKSYGHQPVLVTRRGQDNGFHSLFRGNEVSETVGYLIPTVFCKKDESKTQAAYRAGFSIDVWLDDHPEGIAGIGMSEIDHYLRLIWGFKNRLAELLTDRAEWDGSIAICQTQKDTVEFLDAFKAFSKIVEKLPLKVKNEILPTKTDSENSG